MPLKNNFLGYLYLGLCSLSCCDNVEPSRCIGVKPFRADFGIYQSLGDSLFRVDTVVIADATKTARNAYQQVIFRATDGFDKYQWKIGSDPRKFEETTFQLTFNYSARGPIEVTLEAEGKSETACFPDDDGKDIQMQTFQILPLEVFPFAFLGRYEGYITDEPENIFQIEIKDFGERPKVDPGGPERYYGIRLFNLPDHCCGEKFDLYHDSPSVLNSNYRQFFLRDLSCRTKDCKESISALYGRIVNKNVIIIDFGNNKNGGNDFVLRTFIGKRI